MKCYESTEGYSAEYTVKIHEVIVNNSTFLDRFVANSLGESGLEQ